ncbi:MAG: iron ABC transporter permease, partial [Rhizobiales bacterium]|nr:iron ABC transporter permease [Hyphomicrobiales bacterium]
MSQPNIVSNKPKKTNNITAFFQRILHLPRDINPLWLLPAIIMVLCLVVPILTIFDLAFNPEENIWPHLYATVLGGYISDTLVLILGVGILCLFLGVSTAWLVTMYNFPGRKIAASLLLLPLAMPSYIIAYCYVEIFDYSNIVQSGIRSIGGFSSAKDYWFFEIRSMGGAIFVLSIVLYPYVYLTSRAAFLQQSISMLEASRMLGHSSRSTFLKIALPLARPAIFIGLTLALMECLNDVGAVEFFGVNTLTVGIYATWLERGNLGGGAQIALILLAFIFVLIIFEKSARRGAQYSTTRQMRPIKRINLTKKQAFGAMSFCFMPIILGFVFPTIQLVADSLEFIDDTNYTAFIGYAKNSLMLSSITAILAVIIALFLSYSERIFNVKLVGWIAKLASVGYAIPGVILGLGIFIALLSFDDFIAPTLEYLGYENATKKMILSGSIFAIIFAYLVRFLAV